LFRDRAVASGRAIAGEWALVRAAKDDRTSSYHRIAAAAHERGNARRRMNAEVRGMNPEVSYPSAVGHGAHAAPDARITVAASLIGLVADEVQFSLSCPAKTR
jgi:hypothetical protein